MKFTLVRIMTIGQHTRRRITTCFQLCDNEYGMFRNVYVVILAHRMIFKV